jgi:hypothetical protein
MKVTEQYWLLSCNWLKLFVTSCIKNKS